MAFVGADGWKSGLTALQTAKVEELESRLEKTSRERTQKQMQIDTLNQALEKQKRKVREMNMVGN